MRLLGQLGGGVLRVFFFQVPALDTDNFGIEK
jgi:hypothetical protein